MYRRASLVAVVVAACGVSSEPPLDLGWMAGAADGASLAELRIVETNRL